MAGLVTFDLSKQTVRELNQALHHELGRGATSVRVTNPNGLHSIAAGVDAPVHVEVLGDAGYFLGGMNQQAEITVHGNAGWSVAENIMSGVVRVKGSVSECAAASGHGGLVVIEGDASSRCGISMKGVDIVVGGNVGHMSAFMAQAGHLVVCGNAGPALGDSLYEAVLYVRGTLQGLGADARQEPLQDRDCEKISELLGKAGIHADPQSFKRIASAKSLYHWNVEANQEY
jgi:glutamate synthase domain-containing protein 3